MAITEKDTDVKAMELIKASGVLNPHMTLDKLMEVTQQLAELDEEPLEAHSDKFVHKHFIFKHTD